MPTDNKPNGTTFDHWCADHLQELGAANRGTRSGNEVASFTAREFLSADVLSVHFADGSVLHTGPQDWLERVGRVDEAAEATARGADGKTGRVGSDVGNQIHLTFDLQVSSTAYTAAASRTAGGGALGEPTGRYSLARLTEPGTLDKVYRVGAWLADRVDRWSGSQQAPAASILACKLCRAFESAVLHEDLG